MTKYLFISISSQCGAHLIRGTTLSFTSAVIYSEIKIIFLRLPHLFLEDLLAFVRYRNSALKVASNMAPRKRNMTDSNIWLFKKSMPIKQLQVSIQATNI
jgi:hypothetical protein